MRRQLSLASLLCAGLMSAGASAAQAAPAMVECPTMGTLDKADDPMPALADLGFTASYYGQRFDKIYVTGNGRLTFGERALDGTLQAPTGGFGGYIFDQNTEPMIAPFLADVDTRGSGSVTFGRATFDGAPAFCATWENVGYFNQKADRTNTFQALLVKRGTNGDFDMVFNYDKVEWDKSDDDLGDPSTSVDDQFGPKAVVGFSATTRDARGEGDFVTLRGNGPGEPVGSLTDASATGLTKGSNLPSRGQTAIPGRYVFDGCDAARCPDAAPAPAPTPTPTAPQPSTQRPAPTVTGPSTGSGTVSIPTPVTPQPRPLASLGKLRLSGGKTITVPVSCAATALTACTATVSLKAKGRKIGTGKAKVAPGRTANVRITLSRRARAMFKKGRAVKFTATAVVRDASGASRALSSVLTVRGSRR